MTNRIYCLRDPRTSDVRYIGFTARSLEERLQEHIYARGERTYCYAWIRQLLSQELLPTIEELEVVSEADTWQDRERWWIAYGRAREWPLTNLTAGGDGTPGWKPTPEVREKLRQGQLRPETLERQRQANVGRKHTPETKQRLRLVNVGRKHTPEAREKIRQALQCPEVRETLRQGQLGREHTPEAIEKIRQANVGKKRPPEVREKISTALKGRPKSPEHVEKMRQARLGQRHTPEHTEKVRQAMLRPEVLEKNRQANLAYWARKRAAEGGDEP